VPYTGAYFGFPMDFPLKMVIMMKHMDRKIARKKKAMEVNRVYKISIFSLEAMNFEHRKT